MSEHIEIEQKTSGIQTFKDILLVFAVIAAIKFLKDVFGKGKEDEVSDKNIDAGRQAREKLYKEFPPSYSNDQYEAWADALAIALVGSSDEDEDTVYEIFEMCKNPSDVAKLVEFFGLQRRPFTTQYITLPQAISIFFNRSEKKKLNDILSKKKIPYYFK